MACHVLAKIHDRGATHGDLHPENIIVKAKRGTQNVIFHRGLWCRGCGSDDSRTESMGREDG